MISRQIVPRHRQTHLVKPKETWPKMESGLTMELIEVKNGLFFQTYDKDLSLLCVVVMVFD
jgi:hypothetical protein